MKFLASALGLVFAAVLGILVYLIWFEVNDPGHGAITGKHYSPAYYYTSCVQSVCTPHYMPECYEVKYTDGKHDGDACVSPDEFDRYRVGGQFPEAG